MPPLLNFKPRTLGIMDNYAFLKALNSESIDLIAIDPPFAANETFEGKPKPSITHREFAEEVALAKSHGVKHNEGIGETRVKDAIWKWDNFVHEPWLKEVRVDNEEIGKLIDAVEMCASENEAAYIAFMVARLLECHRVLKKTGSIYVHCDHHANSYLRMAMDAIFGKDNFRNSISWKRYRGRRAPKTPRRYANVTDTLLFYAKDTDTMEFALPFTPLNEEYVERTYKHDDNDGRGRYRYGGRIPDRKYYLNNSRGTPVTNWWDDIKELNGADAEMVGYATQKPLALYQRIIRASSNPGDVVLDMFAGCATTAVAAELEGRKWLACDMAYRSWTMIKRRFYQNGIALSDMTEATPEALGITQPKLRYVKAYTIGPNELPERERTDKDDIYDIPHLELRRQPSLAPWQRMKDKEMRAILEKAQSNGDPRAIVCAGCGRVMEPEFMQLDHDKPKKDGGKDYLDNRVLLCGPCNRRKKDGFTYTGLVKENKRKGWTMNAKAASASRTRRDAAVEIAIAERME